MRTREVDTFEFRLARDLGMTVARLRSELTEAEWVDWQAVYVIEEHHRQHAEAVKADLARAGRL